jgi:hypothetical protein
VSFFYVFDEFYDDPKLADLPAEAPKLSPEDMAVVFQEACIGLWTRAGAWSKKKLTGGFIPRAKVRELGGVPALAEGLVQAKLWEPAPGGYQFHDWDDHQETKVEREEKRERERRKKGAWRRKKASAQKRSAGGHVGGQSGGHESGHDGGQAGGHSSPESTGSEPADDTTGWTDPGTVHGGVLGSPSPSPSPGTKPTTTPRAGAHAHARVEMQLGNGAGVAAAAETLQLTIGAVADELGWDAAPEVPLGQLQKAAKRVLKLAHKRQCDTVSAARVLATAALLRHRATGQPVGLALCEVDSAVQPETGRYRKISNGRMDRAEGTTGADFEGVDTEAQLASMRVGGAT